MNNAIRKIKKSIIMNGALMGLVALCVVFGILSPAFLTQYNIINILRQCSTNLILAVGMTMVILTGGIDLSIGGIMALVGTIVAGFLSKGTPLFFSVLIGLLVGTVFGMLNGFCVAFAEIPPFVTTMAMLSIVRSLALIYTGGYPITGMPENFTFIGSGFIGIIPVPVVIAVVITIFGAFILNKTILGRYIFAIGGNEDAARLSGINVRMWKMVTYILEGVFISIAGIVLTARMNSGQPTMAQGIELDIIAAVVIGGTSLSGGDGGLAGTIMGALLITVLSNGLTLLNVNPYLQGLIIGIVILVSVFIDKRSKK